MRFRRRVLGGAGVHRPPAGGRPAGRGCRDDYVIEDSREGWARAFLFGLETWFAGEWVVFDFSHLRPYGARLKQMGGRASGAESLQHLFADVEGIVAAAGRHLTPLECHDICCMVADKIVMGGKRRSAMISFSDIDDEEMRHAKDFSAAPSRPIGSSPTTASPTRRSRTRSYS